VTSLLAAGHRCIGCHDHNGGVRHARRLAQLAVLPGTTHVGVTRRPGQVLALITPFLDGR
jgi:hypothetical protein